MLTEIEQFSALHGTLEVDTIFFGGGTPSTYPDDLLLDMAGTLNKVLVFAPQAEVTIEVNPGTVRASQLELWKGVGINRLSIGVQSIKDTVLRSLNRHQSAAQVLELLASASTLFDNISVDLIIGLPGVDSDEWKSLLEQLVQWPIKHVSIYFLTVHEDTQLYFRVQKNQITLPSDEQVVPLYEWSVAFLAQHGFEQYELSNFARSGYYSRHNSTYWNRVPYKGFGIGACSFDGHRRFANEKNILKYMAALEQGMSVGVFSETLTPQQHRLEHIMLALRRPKGIEYDVLIQGLTQAQRVTLDRTIDVLKQEGYLSIDGQRVCLTIKGLTVHHEMVIKLSIA